MLISSGLEKSINGQIGLRVTHLYDIKTHASIYMPNAALGEANIVNITRPTTDLADELLIGVGHSVDVKKVIKLLEEVVLGHPDVLGAIDQKITHLKTFTEFTHGKDKKTTSLERLQAEQNVNAHLQNLEKAFEKLIRQIMKLEAGGLDKDDVAILQASYQEILLIIGLDISLDKHGRRDNLQVEYTSINSDNLIRAVYYWTQAWLRDPDLVSADQNNLPSEWHKKITFLKNKIVDLHHLISDPSGHETRLDNYASEIERWLHENFKEARVLWKDPEVELSGFNYAGLEFSVRFFIDNIKLEHWERADRVKNELRREIIRRFRKAKIDLVYPE